MSKNCRPGLLGRLKKRKLQKKAFPKYNNKKRKKKFDCPKTEEKKKDFHLTSPTSPSLQEKKSLFKNPFQDLKTKNKKKKKVKRSIPKVPIENCPTKSIAIIGNQKAKDGIKAFLNGNRYSVCIVWGAHGVGKSSTCHLLFRENNIWPHTTEEMLDHVRVGGKRPKLSQSLKRMMRQRLPRKEIFFLDHIESFCINDPEEIKTIVRILVSDEFQRCGIKMVIGIDNLYSKECAVFRKLLEPVKVNKNQKRTVATHIRFYKLNNNHVDIILKQKGIFGLEKLKRGTQVANGDGRQACLFARMEKMKGTNGHVVGNMDLVLNPFDSCRMAFEGKKEQVLSGSEWNILKELLFHNYPKNVKMTKSTWDLTITPAIQRKIKGHQPLSAEEKGIVRDTYTKDLEALDEIAKFSDLFSDSLKMSDDHGEYMTLTGCETMKKRKPVTKWPDTLFMERRIREKRNGFDKMRMFYGFQREDVTTVCKLIEPKIIQGDKAILDWCFTYDMPRSLIHEQAHVFE